MQPVDEKPVPFAERVKAPPAKPAVPDCAYCGGPVWDNREDKRNPKAPDFKGKDKDCGAAAWLRKDGDLKWTDPL